MPKRSFWMACLAWAAAGGACGASPDGHRGEDPAVAVSPASTRAWLRTARFEDADRATDCRPDCREQERGFAYARAYEVDQPGDCDLARVKARASEDFIEGCRAYGQYLEAAAAHKR